MFVMAPVSRDHLGKYYSALWKDLENALKIETTNQPVMECANQSKIGHVCVCVHHDVTDSELFWTLRLDLALGLRLIQRHA